ncbi:hypothetical protein L3V83_12230 [Thiotrichales bacterium 19X7-9]|nr:hypothetical protein [Thiotrichales bacterium 19X7-9]
MTNTTNALLEKSTLDTLQQMTDCAQKTLNYFSSHLNKDGSFGDHASDLTCYYKAPMMFINAQREDLAKRVINNIKVNYMQKDGDLLSNATTKSIKPEYIEFWAYMNSWIERAAYKLDIKELSEPVYNYINQYQIGQTNKKELDTGITDVLTAAYQGLINLERDQLTKAFEAANYLCDCYDKQPDLLARFYLRFNQNNDPITDFSQDQAIFCCVSKTQTNQLYFMLAYPSAFLSLLYLETKDEKYLKYAKAYTDYALSCHTNVLSSPFSHKLAWALSILYKIIKNPLYLFAIKEISSYFVQIQAENGLWFQDEVIETSYDQSAELACWFFEISDSLRQLIK